MEKAKILEVSGIALRVSVEDFWNYTSELESRKIKYYGGEGLKNVISPLIVLIKYVMRPKQWLPSHCKMMIFILRNKYCLVD